MANIATTGNPTEFIDSEMTPHFETHWRAAPATSCGAVNPSPAQTSVGLVLNEQNTKISAIHMLAPSPDWFTGIKAVEMCVDGYWATTKTVTGVPYDAGVDGGVFFRSEDMAQGLNTNKVTPIVCDGANGPFCNQDNTGVNPVVKFVIETSEAA